MIRWLIGSGADGKAPPDKRPSTREVLSKWRLTPGAFAAQLDTSSDPLNIF